MATAAQNGRVALYDVSTLGSSRVELAWIYQHTGEVNKLDFDPFSGYMLLSGSQDKYCKTWDIRDPRKPAGLFQYHVRAPVRDVRWAPTDAWIFALCTEGGVVQKWDVRNTRQPQLSISAHEKSCYTIAWHPDGKHLASGGFDKYLRVWDFGTENRRQKPVFQLKGPHGIMNLAWRPPCWSAEFARAGTWQCTQIATSYTDDDPRVHVWDLRRPLLPFRELNQYDTRPMDLLWPSKDLLWTVGGAGIFAQNDMTHAPHVEDALPPSAAEWAADGSFYAVVEDKSPTRRVPVFDPAAVFLNIPQDRLSGTEDGIASRSLTDDEDSEIAFSEHSRRQSKAGSTRSGKSQANTPPNHEDEPQVLPLDRAVLGKKDMFVNGQVGALSILPGVHSPSPVVEFIANNYAQAMTTAERGSDPSRVLERLENALLHNANVCEIVTMHRSAQTWRILAAVVVPELKEWADYNRNRRLAQEDAQRNQQEAETRNNQTQNTLSPFAKSVADGRSPARSEKIVGNIFRGILGSQRGTNDNSSTSNMTTPLARPLMTPPPTSKRDESTWFTLDEAIEPIQPLPPSLANAHSTAAAASRALLDNTSNPSSSPMSSPEKTRFSPDRPKGHKRSSTESARTGINNRNVTNSPTSGQRIIQKPSHVSIVNPNQEDRRAALRDYKATTRQLFSLEASVSSPKYGRVERHDSSESFSMFSPSTSGSARARSMGHSFDVPDQPVARKGSEDWNEMPSDRYYDSIPRSTAENQYDSSNSGRFDRKDFARSQTTDFAMDDSPQLPFGLDGASESGPVAPVEQHFREMLASSSSKPLGGSSRAPQEEETRPQSLEQGLSEHIPPPERIVHHHNPYLNEQINHGAKGGIPLTEHDLKFKPYHPSDFRPIDITTYQTNRPFALSAFPIICQTIEQDVNHGFSVSQFSCHLLSYILPFFFHQSTRSVSSFPLDAQNAPTTLADRMMNPSLSARIIEGIFTSHIEHLRRLKLFLPAAELRKLCVEEFGYPNIAGSDITPHNAKSAGDTLKVDPLKIKSTCSNCKSFMPMQATACRNCSQKREQCPICELPISLSTKDASLTSTLFAYCHVCGHSAHTFCMSTWLSLPDVHGECPTPFCGCDCGPGKVREQRITRQLQAREEDAVIRGSSASDLKKDSIKVGPSPAVDRARESLRKRSIVGERGTQSGDEGRGSAESAWSKKSSGIGANRGLGRSNSGSGAANNGGSSFGRRVRVVEPDK